MRSQEEIQAQFNVMSVQMAGLDKSSARYRELEHVRHGLAFALGMINDPTLEAGKAPQASCRVSVSKGGRGLDLVAKFSDGSEATYEYRDQRWWDGRWIGRDRLASELGRHRDYLDGLEDTAATLYRFIRHTEVETEKSRNALIDRIYSDNDAEKARFWNAVMSNSKRRARANNLAPCLAELSGKLSPYAGPTYPSVVYFLMDSEECVYVGETEQFDTRMKDHKRDKTFNEVYFMTCPPEHRKRIEWYWIDRLQPKYNERGTKKTRRRVASSAA